ncbi:hypothetical protein GCM10007298_19380 [Williamsia phyllosphaerae]|uniref:DUF4190 domain-containing protein n=1 Tax=Williamsia phyllosphaerae TaxID=885042 RepID=A0ABQ1UQN0_9NOCA|nr:hypothetical protein GCM10007298_19380 [Williamsia phyllosphaerae]
MTDPERGGLEDSVPVSLVKAQPQRPDATSSPLPTEQINTQAYSSSPPTGPLPGLGYPHGQFAGPQDGLPIHPGSREPATPPNTTAVVAMVLAVLTGPVSIPFAHVARNQVAATGQRGRPLAAAALGIGYGWLGALLGLGLGFVLLLQFAGEEGYQPISRTVGAAETVTSTAAAAPPAAAGAAPGVRTSPPPGATPCPRLSANAGGYNQSGTGTAVTSCEFSEAVRVAYGNSGPPAARREVNAFSTVTRQPYVMTCSPESDYVVCRGGVDAVAIIWAASS